MLPAHCHRRVHVATRADLTSARGVLADLTCDLTCDPISGPACDRAADEDMLGRIQLVVSELATNLIRHAGGGVLLLRRLRASSPDGSTGGPADGPADGIECLSLDTGPGIADIGAALADRHNPEPEPGQSLGYGLGAVRRLSDRFDIHSGPGLGTAVLARVHRRRDPALPGRASFFDYGAAMAPMAGCGDCGDGWAVRPDGLVLVVDGLGHGEAASVAARRAEAVFAAAPTGEDPQTVLASIHRALSGTRGAVAIVLRLHADRVEFSSVGNIAAAVLHRTGSTPLGGRWGVVGYNAVPPPPAAVPWGPGDQIVLHSDGCSHLMGLIAERHLRHADPALAAAVLLRDGAGRIDDQTVLVLANRADAGRFAPSRP